MKRLGFVFGLNRQAKPVCFCWCGLRDSNPHGFPHGPEPCASANSAKTAYSIALPLISCDFSIIYNYAAKCKQKIYFFKFFCSYIFFCKMQGAEHYTRVRLSEIYIICTALLKFLPHIRRWQRPVKGSALHPNHHRGHTVPECRFPDVDPPSPWNYRT